MTHLEASLETYFLQKVRGIGGLTHKLAATTKGMPDRLVLLPGGVIRLVELKTTTGRRSPAQELWHTRAAQVGTVVATLHGRAEVDAWLRTELDTISGIEPDRVGSGRPRGRKLPDSDPVVVTCHTCDVTVTCPSQLASEAWLEAHFDHRISTAA